MLAALGLLALAAVAVAGDREYSGRQRQATSDLLHAMARGQARRTEAYVRERVRDAAMTASHPSVQALLGGRLRGPDADRERAALLERWRVLSSLYGYHNAQLFDASLGSVMTIVHDEAESPLLRAYVRDAMERRVPVIVPMRFDLEGNLEFGAVVPVLEQGTSSPRVLGAVYFALLVDGGLLADLRDELPATDSRALFVVQDARDSLFVLPALIPEGGRFRVETRIVARDTASVATKAFAAVDAPLGTLRGSDLGGQAVYAAAVPIAGTPWRVVASLGVDDAERRIRMFRMLVVVGHLLLAAVLLAFFRAAAARRREELAEVSARVGQRAVRVVQTSLDGFVTLDRDGWVLDANAALAEMTGYGIEELQRLNIADLRVNAARDEAQEMLSRLTGTDGIQYRCLWRRKDGTHLDLDVSARYLEEDGVGRIVAFLRDVTGTLQTQRRLERSGHLYALLNRANEALYESTSVAEACRAVCDAFVADGEFRLAWVGLVDDEQRQVRPVAASGVAATCVNDLFGQMAEAAGEVRGPQRQAIESGEPVVINDFHASADTAPWHGLAARHEIGSVAIFPIRREWRCRHLLLVYHHEVGYFAPDLVRLITEVARFLGAVLSAQEAAETRHREEARFRALFEASPLPMLVLDEASGRIQRVNRVFNSTFGYSDGSFTDFTGLQRLLYPEPELRRVASEQFRGIVAQLTEAQPTSATPAHVVACASGETRYAQAFVTRIGDELLVAYADLTTLRRSEALAAEAQEIAQLVSWEFDFATQRLIDPSPNVRRHLSRDGNAVSPFDVVIPEDREMVLLAMERAVRERTPLDVTARLEMQDGQIRYHRGRMRIEFDAFGRPVRGIGSSQDVTDAVVLQRELESHRSRLQELVDARTAELEQAVARLQRTDRRLKAMFQLSQVAPTLDERELLQRAVDEAERLTESKSACLLLVQDAQPAPESVTWSAAMQAMSDALPTLETVSGIWEEAVRGACPVVRNALEGPEAVAALGRHVAMPVVDHGEVSLVLGVCHKDAPYGDDDVHELELIARDIWNILQRRRTEVALERAYEQVAASDARFTFAMEASAEGIWDWDLVTGEMTYSREYVNILGYEAHEMPATGNAWARLVHPTDRDRIWAQILVDLKSDAAGLQEFRIRRKDGSYIWVQKWGRVVARDANGYALRVVGTFADLSARRAAEEELRNAKEAADEANRAKSVFLATMSHEIRTPLNGVMGMADVLAQSTLPAREAEAVKTIRSSAAALLTLIDDILDFSKIDAGRLELDLHETDLDELVEQVITTLRPVATARHVELSMFVAPDVPRLVMADSVRLRQIIFNLLGNAVKFAAGRLERPGRVALRIVREGLPYHTPRLRITVRDDGIGIAPEAQERLFETFSQAEQSTTRRFGGTGLGLAITKRLTELMGGDISVESAVDEGATFHVVIPVQPLATQPPRPRPDLRGVLTCIVPAARDFGQAEDLATYARHAGATAEIFDTLAQAREVAAARGAAAVVVDWASLGVAESAGLPDDASVRHLRLAHGDGRRPRVVSASHVVMDLAGLCERTFLSALAIAAGRASPDVTPEEAAEPSEPQVQVPISVAEARASGRLILVAEDDEVNQRVILRQLELLGYAAEIAGDGEEALRMWKGGGYAMLLTDLHMPTMDGYQLTVAIRAQEDGARRLPIVALTANALRGEEVRARALGMDGYLTKPIRLMDLKHELQSRLHPDAPAVPAAAAGDVEAPAVADADAAPGVDVRVLEQFIGDDAELVQEFLHEYRKSAELHTAALARAAAAGDLKQVGMSAHTLKSSSRAAGATKFGDLLAELEVVAKRDDAGAVGPVVASVMAEYDRVMNALEALAPRQ